jgi:hypothetical protein
LSNDEKFATDWVKNIGIVPLKVKQQQKRHRRKALPLRTKGHEGFTKLFFDFFVKPLCAYAEGITS